MKILFLYQNIISGSNISTDYLLKHYRILHPEDICVVYKQKPLNYHGPFAYLVNLLWSILDFRRFINITKNPEIIYATYFTAGIAHYISSNRKTLFVFHVHGDQAFTVLSQISSIRNYYRSVVSFIVKSVQSFTLYHANILCFVSPLAMKDFLYRYFLTGLARKAVIIPNGVDPDIFHPSKIQERVGLKQNNNILSEFVITYIGRVDRKKGVVLLIRAIKNLNLPSVCCLIVSPKPDDKYARNYYKELHVLAGNLKVKCIFIQNPENVSEYYRLSDCIVLPSRQEMSSMVVLEALSSGVPILATPVGDTKEIFGPRLISLLLKKSDPEYIASRIRWAMFLSGRQKKQLIDNCINIAGKHSWSVAVQKLHKTFSGLLNSDNIPAEVKIFEGNPNGKSYL